MKKFLLGLFMTLSLMTQASHLAGGDIQYRYIGDSTGIARHYKVILRLYRDVTGITMATNDIVNIYNGCGTSFTVPVTLVAGSGVVSPTLFDCVDPGTSTKTLEVYQYIGYTTLPVNCSDYTFWYSNCCRPAGISNIAASSGQGFYFDAKLNNVNGQNSSPIFISEPVRAFCVGNTFNWKQTAIEEDGDSIVYTLVNCRQGVYVTQTDIPYLAGWTTQQPVTSSLFTLNPNSGQITFSPTMSEIDVMSIIIEEYRWDTLNLWWYPIGTASRDMMISVSPNCNPSAISGVQYDTSLYDTDTITGFPLIKASCGDLSFTLKFHIALDCYSINDVDFRMTNTNTGQPWAIDSLWSVCDANAETDSIIVNLFQPFNQPGRYYLYSKKGNDGNTLINKCGIPMNEFDTIVVKVGPCPPPPPPGEAPNLLEPTGLPLPPPVILTPVPEFPNVMTPNGDGINDWFYIENGSMFDNVSLLIYNRWGTLVYQNNDYKDDFGGSEVGLSDGVYFWACELYFKQNDKTLYKSGNLTIFSE